MRVLHVSQPIEAGVANVVVALVADQVARGYDVHVACPSGRGSAQNGLPQRAAAVGAVVTPWEAVRSPGSGVPGETRQLRHIVDTVDPDVVVLHSAKAGLAGRLALRGSRPTVHVPHAWSFEAVHGAMAVAARAWETTAGRWSDVAVCVSADEAERGRAAGIRCATVVIPNGVDTETRVPRDAVAARAALGLGTAPTVVCVGRLAEQKGQDLLLQAWRGVRTEIPDARLVLVGDGPDREALEGTAPAGVTFTGARSDVDALLAAAHVVALPSRWEASSLVVLEAMAAGRPVVAFDVDGVRTTVGDAGVVLAPGDVDGMARELIRLLRDPAAAVALGRAARDQVVAVGDLRSSLKQWDEVLTRFARPASTTTGDGPPVSVVITVLDEGHALARTVDGLIDQLAPGDELVVVDGGSTDGSIEKLCPHPALRVEVVPGAGISQGRNIGIRVARHEVIVCTDAGCSPEPGFVDGMRRAFAGAEPPALASGVYRVLARTPLERAQSLACYPQPDEVDRPDAFVRAYTRVFGTGFDPRYAVGRCVAFTRTAWSAAGGFPEHLATGEDVSFGLAVAGHGACVAAPAAVVGWTQRDGLAATWRMYRGYGRASTDGGDARLLVRDAARGAAYLVALALMTRPGGRRLAAVGAAVYLSLPVVRAVRARAGLAATALLPVAMATKDLGKLTGAVAGLVRRGSR